MGSLSSFRRRWQSQAHHALRVECDTEGRFWRLFLDCAKRYTHYTANGFEVWGKEYEDSRGKISWRLRVFSEQDRRIETYETAASARPRCFRIGEARAIEAAI